MKSISLASAQKPYLCSLDTKTKQDQITKSTQHDLIMHLLPPIQQLNTINFEESPKNKASKYFSNSVASTPYPDCNRLMRSYNVPLRSLAEQRHHSQMQYSEICRKKVHESISKPKLDDFPRKKYKFPPSSSLFESQLSSSSEFSEMVAPMNQTIMQIAKMG